MPQSALRTATPSDSALVAHHRALMFHEIGDLPIERIAAFEKNARPVIERLLAEAVYHHWFIEGPSGAVIASGGVQVRPLLPRPDTDRSFEAIILNMYVEVAHRRRGHARRIVQAILDWCRGQNIDRIVLHASPAGRSLYESMGFTPTSEMRFGGQCVEE
jgi:GNAT superfamily N-acetyltransferase